MSTGEWRLNGRLSDTQGRHSTRKAAVLGFIVDDQDRMVYASEATTAARRRIEDLHDGVQQRLTSELIRLRLARRRLDTDPVAAAELLEQCLGELEAAVEELRELARGIHPSILTRTGLPTALRGLTSRVSIPVQLRCSVEGRLPAPVEAAAYLVCSESLTNVEKHARATSADVSVTESAAGVSVEISDDGVRGVREQEGGGIEGLRDRVEALGGSLHVRDRTGGGTVLSVALPR